MTSRKVMGPVLGEVVGEKVLRPPRAAVAAPPAIAPGRQYFRSGR
jgi:hypothetical protein